MLVHVLSSWLEWNVPKVTIATFRVYLVEMINAYCKKKLLSAIVLAN